MGKRERGRKERLMATYKRERKRERKAFVLTFRKFMQVTEEIEVMEEVMESLDEEGVTEELMEGVLGDIHKALTTGIILLPFLTQYRIHKRSWDHLAEHFRHR
jgi:hypothetical protein